jgi:phosphopantetheinyl transferase
LLQAVLWQTRRETAALSALEILNATDGAPFVKVNGKPAGLHLSISHSRGFALCAVAADPIGADLEWIEPREASFIEDFLTAREQVSVNALSLAQRDALVTAIWSAKEAGLKALHVGLRVDTRAIEISDPGLEPLSQEWVPYSLTVQGEDARPLAGWWCARHGFVLSLAGMTNDVPRAASAPARILSGVYDG